MDPKQRNPGFATLFLFLGCFLVVAGFVGYLSTNSIWGALQQFTLGAMCFAIAAYYTLPNHLRRTKQGLRIFWILIAVAGLTLAVYDMYTIPTDWAKPAALVMAILILMSLGIGLVFYLKRRQENRSP